MTAADRDIPEEMVEKATRRLYEVERIVRPFERLSPERQTELRSNARSVLSAALAGHQVVDLPTEPADELAARILDESTY